MKINLIKIIPKNIKIYGIGLLSEQEFRKYRNTIPKIPDSKWSWWLRPDTYGEVALVDRYNNVWQADSLNSIKGVRPVLKINKKEAKLQIGDRFEIDSYSWTVISDEYALCDEIVWAMQYRKKTNAADSKLFVKSDIKKWLEDWCKDINLEITEQK